MSGTRVKGSEIQRQRARDQDNFFNLPMGIDGLQGPAGHPGGIGYPGPKGQGYHKLTYKGVLFETYFDDEVLECIANPADVQKSEMDILSMVHPEDFARIRLAWADSYNLQKAAEIFDSY